MKGSTGLGQSVGVLWWANIATLWTSGAIPHRSGNAAYLATACPLLVRQSSGCHTRACVWRVSRVPNSCAYGEQDSNLRRQTPTCLLLGCCWAAPSPKGPRCPLWLSCPATCCLPTCCLPHAVATRRRGSQGNHGVGGYNPKVFPTLCESSRISLPKQISAALWKVQFVVIESAVLHILCNVSWRYFESPTATCNSTALGLRCCPVACQWRAPCQYVAASGWGCCRGGGGGEVCVRRGAGGAGHPHCGVCAGGHLQHGVLPAPVGAVAGACVAVCGVLWPDPDAGGVDGPWNNLAGGLGMWGYHWARPWWSFIVVMG